MIVDSILLTVRGETSMGRLLKISASLAAGAILLVVLHLEMTKLRELRWVFAQ